MKRLDRAHSNQADSREKTAGHNESFVERHASKHHGPNQIALGTSQ